jgi:hypothetical protein
MWGNSPLVLDPCSEIPEQRRKSSVGVWIRQLRRGVRAGRREQSRGGRGPTPTTTPTTDQEPITAARALRIPKYAPFAHALPDRR